MKITKRSAARQTLLAHLLMALKKFSSSPLSPPPLTTTIEPVLDWAERATPRAQTMEEFGKTVVTSHPTDGTLHSRIN